VALVFAIQGCAQQETAEPDEPAATEPTAEQPIPTPEEEQLYTSSYKPKGDEIAVIETDKGTIKFTFYPEDAPNHVGAFIELVQKGFYDGTKFHRVEPNFVIQGGDPLSKTDDPMVGTGGPGYMLAEEFNSRQHLDGTVAMARSQDPDSAGSQFYICLGPQPFLDGQYTVFGQVTEGMDVVRQITAGDVMKSVTVENASE
jgi:peptidyl-prolyl cis-trans isomerase B (cyclophilin B)